jgi:lipase maturation factor 1
MSGARPVMVFDGDCRFCRRWVARWRRSTKNRVAYIAYQRIGGKYPDLSPESCEQAVQFRESSGQIHGGADAVVRLFDYGLPGGRAARLILSQPPIIWFLRAGYRIIAKRRSLFSRLVRRAGDRRK